ncbi:hypothetical protein CRG98_004304 [Punica granatum]|uniref:Uncharacterized protein n=1 Tax=Punica granatum TaxID=22663 RepID=A0A2I0L3K2_PUNGR|nr:hypothetical protein CRG98_004304 [Punica granatum]
MEDGVGGRGCMKESGVLGGSILGVTFLQASTNAESAVGAAGRSVERARAEARAEARTGWRRRAAVARRNMAEDGVSGIARLSQDQAGDPSRGVGGRQGSLPPRLRSLPDAY